MVYCTCGAGDVMLLTADEVARLRWPHSKKAPHRLPVAARGESLRDLLDAGNACSLLRTHSPTHTRTRHTVRQDAPRALLKGAYAAILCAQATSTAQTALGRRHAHRCARTGQRLCGLGGFRSQQVAPTAHDAHSRLSRLCSDA